MTDGPHLLHNMSVPPRTTVSFHGLAGPGRRCAAMTGLAVTFPAPARPAWRSIADLADLVDAPPAADPRERIVAAIEQCALTLDVPDGALVVDPDGARNVEWPGLLPWLTVVTKITGRVWLRSKAPSLSAVAEPADVSLFVPAPWADDLLPQVLHDDHR